MKFKTLILALSTAVLLTGCGNDAPKEETNAEEQEIVQEETNSAEMPNKIVPIELKAGESWELDDKRKLTVNKATATEERNPYSEIEPAQVVIIDYTYENLGYKDNIGGDKLFFSPDTVIDEKGNVGQDYPAKVTAFPQEIPVGTKVQHAESAWGLDEKSNEIKVLFEKLNGNKLETITYIVPIDESIEKETKLAAKELKKETKTENKETKPAKKQMNTVKKVPDAKESDKSQEIPKDGKIRLYRNAKVIKDMSISYATSDMIDEETLADWYFNYVEKHDYKAYFIVYTDKDKKEGVFTNGLGPITVNGVLQQEKGGTFAIVDHTDETLNYLASSDGTLTLQQ